MPKFTYTGDVGREYPTLPEGCRLPEVGVDYDLPEDPDDGRWTPAGKTSDKPAKPVTDQPTQE